MILSTSAIISSRKDPPPVVDLGTIVSYTFGDYFDAYSSRDGITTTDAFNTNNGCYQLYYSHKQVKINSGTLIGLNPYSSGNNSWGWWISISTVNDTIGSFPATSPMGGIGVSAYSAGVLYSNNTTATFTIPANRYFLIGNTGGPFFRTVKSLANSRTAQISGENYFTVINRVWLAPHSGGGTTQIPTQLGGTGTYTEYNGYAHVHSVTFNV